MDLHTPVYELEQNMSITEFRKWNQYYDWKHKQHKLAQGGGNEVDLMDDVMGMIGADDE